MAKIAVFEGKRYSVPDGTKDEEIAAFVESQVAKVGGAGGSTLAPTPAAPVPAPPQGGGLRPMPAPLASHPLFWAAQQGVDLPTALGGVGGFMPGPVGRGVSALGGASGSIIDQLARGVPLDLGDAVRAGGKQAGLTAGGQMLGGLSRALGTGTMKMALRPGVNTIRQAPNVAVDALEQGATVRRMPLLGGGEKQAAEEVGRRGAVTMAGARRVDAQGVPLPGGGAARVRVRMSSMIPSIDDVVAKKSSKGIREREQAKAVIAEMLDNYKRPQTMEEVKLVKQQLQDEARAVWEALPNPNKKLRFNSAGIPIGEDVPIEVRIKFATANRLQKFMESIPEKATGIPGGFKASEAATKKAIGVRGAIKDATTRADAGLPTWMPQGFGRGALALGGGAAGAAMGSSPQERGAYGTAGLVLGGAMADPGVTSRMAHLLYQQHLLPALLRQAPRGVDALFNDGALPDSLRNR